MKKSLLAGETHHFYLPLKGGFREIERFKGAPIKFYFLFLVNR